MARLKNYAKDGAGRSAENRSILVANAAQLQANLELKHEMKNGVLFKMKDERSSESQNWEFSTPFILPLPLAHGT